jgi:hypothetical protein
VHSGVHPWADVVKTSLRIPKVCQGSYFPPFLEPRKTAEKALVTVITGSDQPPAERQRSSSFTRISILIITA